jgi:hypothetical protein
MSLSLKKEKMIEYLEDVKIQGENFRCMLWGTVYAKLSDFHNHSAVSIIMFFTPAPGVSGFLNNAFCYIGLTEESLYVVALDSYDTARIIGNFKIPLSSITSLNMRKGLGSHTIEIGSNGFISLNVKSTSIGTNIADQKKRMEEFLVAIEALKSSIPG